jgi:hypothetical protein
LPAKAAAPAAPLQIALIDDDPFVAELWQISAAPSRIHYFASAQQFLDVISSTPLLNELNCVVTDFYFSDEDMRGSELARVVKTMNPGLPIFVCSNAGTLTSDHFAGFDGVLDKGQPFDIHLNEIRKVG